MPGIITSRTDQIGPLVLAGVDGGGAVATATTSWPA